MTLDEAIKLIEHYNAWRRNTDDDVMIDMPNPTEIGIALTVVVKAAKEHSTLSMVMNQIADKTRKTKEQRLANACVMFLGSMG